MDKILKNYKKFKEKKSSRWDFANNVLYRLCKENPKNNDSDKVVAKIWLIGRAYAAAIERRKIAKGGVKDFYYDVVAPKMLKIGNELDKRISKLKSTKNIEECIPEILYTHKLLMDAFKNMTGMDKRSLASKYLHFHCPDKFFIYDSRANTAIKKIDKALNLSKKNKIDDKLKNYDKEYANFLYMMISFRDVLRNELKIKNETPRSIDSFLLYSFNS